eukprot:3381037-Rhodomonas_salina.1
MVSAERGLRSGACDCLSKHVLCDERYWPRTPTLVVFCAGSAWYRRNATRRERTASVKWPTT